MRITLKSSTKEFVDQELEVPDDLAIRDLLEVVQKRFLLNGEYGLATMGPGSRVLPSNVTLAAGGLRTGMIVQMVMTGRRPDSAPPPPTPPMPSRPEMPPPTSGPQIPVQPIVPPTQPPVSPPTIVEAPPPAAPEPQAEAMRTMMDIPLPPIPAPKPALTDTLQEIPIPPPLQQPKPPDLVNIWMEPAPMDSQADLPMPNTIMDGPPSAPSAADVRREVTKPLSNMPAPGEMYVSKPEFPYPPPGAPIPTVADPLASLPPIPAPTVAPSAQEATPPEFAGFGPSVHSALLSDDGQVFRLSLPVTIIGRPGKSEHGKVDVDLSILDPNKSTSRPHARIELRKGQYLVRDLMSSNGVLVNKVRITPAVDALLQDGDKLQLGNVRLTFRIVQPAR